MKTTPVARLIERPRDLCPSFEAGCGSFLEEKSLKKPEIRRGIGFVSRIGIRKRTERENEKRV
jgi:hypothetical protein